MEGRAETSRILAVVCQHLLAPDLETLSRPEPLPAARPPRRVAGKRDSGTARDVLIDEFSTRGLVVLAPSTLGVPEELHKTIFAKRLANSSSMVNSIPEVIEVLNAPGVVAALEVLGGRDYAIVPFCHAFFASGGTDQCWHKDDNVRLLLVSCKRLPCSIFNLY